MILGTLLQTIYRMDTCREDADFREMSLRIYSARLLVSAEWEAANTRGISSVVCSLRVLSELDKI